MIDSHIHLDLVEQYHPHRIDWLIENGCWVISWAFGNNIRTENDLLIYLHAQVASIERIQTQGLDCRFLAGIHPRNIPMDLDAKDASKLLMPFLEHPLCLGLGEVGLETGSERECDILQNQLGLMDEIRSLGKKIGIHTPRSLKAEVTRTLLDLLKDFPGIHDLTVIDHTTKETLPWILEAGYHAGITASPIKTSVEELTGILSDHALDLDRIMINSDSGSEFYEDVINLNNCSTIDKPVREQILEKTATRFFNFQ